VTSEQILDEPALFALTGISGILLPNIVKNGPGPCVPVIVSLSVVSSPKLILWYEGVTWVNSLEGG